MLDIKKEYNVKEKELDSLNNESRLFRETLESMKKLNSQL